MPTVTHRLSLLPPRAYAAAVIGTSARQRGPGQLFSSSGGCQNRIEPIVTYGNVVGHAGFALRRVRAREAKRIVIVSVVGCSQRQAVRSYKFEIRMSP